MTSIAVSKVIEILLDVWSVLSSFASDAFDVLTTSISDLLTQLTYADFAKPFWNWVFNELGLGEITLLHLLFGTLPFFIAYTIIKWFTDVVL